MAAEGQQPGAGALGRQSHQVRAVGHQRLIGGAGPIPFQQGELGMVQGTALAIAPYPGEIEDLGFARRQQLLGRELRRGVQVERRAFAAHTDCFGGEGVQVSLVAGRDLQRRTLDFQEALRLEPVAEGALDRIARQQETATLGVEVGAPPGGRNRALQGGFPLRRKRTCLANWPPIV